MTRYHLDPVFDRTLDGAVKGIIRYDICLDGQFVGSRRTHALCHAYLDELSVGVGGSTVYGTKQRFVFGNLERRNQTDLE
jgi:hypothetical protein